MPEELNPKPYMNDKVIQDCYQMVGRGDLFKEAYAVIAASGSISIVGPPRIGKGSLLYCLRFEELQLRYGAAYIEKLRQKVFVFVDMRSLTGRSWKNFFRGLNREIVKQCQGVVDLNAVSIEGSEGFSALLDEIEDQGYWLVLTLDSFEKVRENEQLNNDLPMFLRSEAGRVSYVVASTIELHEIFPEEPISSPFYNIFPYPVKIGVLSPADACELVVTQARDAGLPFSSREVDGILKLGGGHPFFLQLICRMLFEKKVAASSNYIELEGIEDEAYQKLFLHFRALLQGMDEREKEKLLYELRKEGLAEFYGSMLFRRFVEAQAGGKAGLQVKDIKAALKNLSKPSTLGSNPLKHTRVIERYLKLADRAKASPSEIGIAIREVIIEACELLKGQGARSDTAPEWESYNILYYCYIKHHMQNEQVGARIGISARTFYRKKNEAIEKLFIALQELEDVYLRGDAGS